MIVALVALLCAMLTPALAQEQVRIGMGYGLAFLPLYICEDLKLVEKHAKAAHLDVKTSFPHFSSVEQMDDAIRSGTIDIGPFGTVPLLAAWAKAKGTPQQIFAVSGLTSLPLVLLSNQADEHSFTDLKPADRIAVPTPTSPQMYLLEMQAEKSFGQYDKLKNQVVVLSHGDAIAALVGASEQKADNVTAYFSSPPFTQLALRATNVHPLLRSSDVMNGKSSFLVLGATKAAIEAHPQMASVVEGAIDEAARIIHDDPRRAAQIYLTYEPSGSINGAAMAAVIGDIKDEFGSAVYGVQAIADFLSRHGDLKTAPKSFKDVVVPDLANSPSN
jgi:NitT/TauT family transport system substrate-binding protein